MSKFVEHLDQDDSIFLLQAICTDFLNKEASLLDDWQFEDWLSLLTDDIVYKVPVTVTKENVGDKFSSESYYFDEDKNSLETRINRLESDFVWSEIPRSHTRRLVTNVRVVEVNDTEISVKNNCLFHFVREHKDVTFTYERHDTIRRIGSDLKLAERKAYIDNSKLPTQFPHLL